MFKVTSPSGREQQMSAMPSSGGSNGSMKYDSVPETSSHWHVLQIPERQLKSGLSPCASARSRRLACLSSQTTVFLENAKVTVAGLEVAGFNAMERRSVSESALFDFLRSGGLMPEGGSK